MLKPQMPNIPGVGAMSDTLDFVKNLWGSMSVPGINLPSMASPTLSVDELDKKIADLKAVESWLNVNVSMLRGTIQALEVQRGTIATLKSMGATLANAVKQPGANEKTVLAAAPYASAFFSQPAAEPAKPAPKPEPVAAILAPAPVPAAKPDAKPDAAADTPALTPAAAAMANPVAWWNMLQDQFKQAVTTAMSSEAAAKLSAASAGQVEKLGNAIAKNAPKPAAKAAAAKPAAKKAAAKPKAAKKLD
jgi:hypothetical protein